MKQRNHIVDNLGDLQNDEDLKTRQKRKEDLFFYKPFLFISIFNIYID